MKKKTVSVIIPVYNGERYIRQSVECALSQTFKDLEVIVVDDASKDFTGEIIKSIRDERLRYHRNKRNMERVYSRNLGYKMSSGRFIFFLDYDDLWEKDYIEETVSYLESGYDIVYSVPRRFINEEGQVVRVSKKKLPQSVEEIIFSGLMGYPSASAFRRESFLEYREEFLFREDWEIYIRSFLKGLKIKILDNDKVFIREHSSRTSRSLKFMEATLKVYKRYISEIPEEFKALFTLHTAHQCMRYGNLYEGWKLALKAMFLNPRIFLNLRNLLYTLKWGIRVDRLIKFSVW